MISNITVNKNVSIVEPEHSRTGRIDVWVTHKTGYRFLNKNGCFYELGKKAREVDDEPHSHSSNKPESSEKPTNIETGKEIKPKTKLIDWDIIESELFFLPIKIKGVSIWDDDEQDIRIDYAKRLDYEDFFVTKEDFIKKMKSEGSLTTVQTQKLIAFVSKYIEEKFDSNTIHRQYSPVSVTEDGIIRISDEMKYRYVQPYTDKELEDRQQKYNEAIEEWREAGTDDMESRGQIEQLNASTSNDKILADLSVISEKASNRNNFNKIAGWAVLAPLHYYIKTKTSNNANITQAPNGITSGKTNLGKTSDASFFAVKGFGQDTSKARFGLNRIKIVFMFTKLMGNDTLPKVIDDVNTQWIIDNAENLKGYGQDGIFGSRGNSAQGQNDYYGKSSFIASLNQNFSRDLDAALGRRELITEYSGKTLTVADKNFHDDLVDDVPNGFMYSLIDEISKSVTISDILKRVRRFRNAMDWVNYGLELINMLMEKHGLSPLTIIDEESTDDEGYTIQIFDAVIAEWNRINGSESEFIDNEGVVHHNSKSFSRVLGEIKVEDKDGRTFIHMTSGAYSYFNSTVKSPHRSIRDFMNNITANEIRVEYDGKRHGVWIPQARGSASCYSFSISRDDKATE